LSSVIILLVADMFWHAVKTAIDHKLVGVEDLGQPNTDEARRPIVATAPCCSTL
jgi:hypothetical protein